MTSSVYYLVSIKLATQREPNVTVLLLLQIVLTYCYSLINNNVWSSTWTNGQIISYLFIFLQSNTCEKLRHISERLRHWMTLGGVTLTFQPKMHSLTAKLPTGLIKRQFHLNYAIYVAIWQCPIHKTGL